MSVTAQLSREKDTKNKVRFQEGGGELEKLGMVYVPKATLAELGNPDRITVTLAAAA